MSLTGEYPLILPIAWSNIEFGSICWTKSEHHINGREHMLLLKDEESEKNEGLHNMVYKINENQFGFCDFW